MAGAARRRLRDGAANGSATDVSLAVIDERRGRWNGRVELLEGSLPEPLRRRTPTVYFVNSRSDLFHEGVPFAFIDRVFAVMARCPQHRFLVLTKRPERMREYLTEYEDGFARASRVEHVGMREHEYPEGWLDRWPLPNVWLGTSVEDQAAADLRVPELLSCPAAGRFVSAEPLLGEVDMSPSLKGSTRVHMCMDIRGAIRNQSFDGMQHSDGTPMTAREAEDALWEIHATGAKVIPVGECDDFDDQTGCRGHRKPGLDWVIVGGESGGSARVCEVEWVRCVVGDCRAASVPVYVKQLGSYVSDGRYHLRELGRRGQHVDGWPEDLRVRELPASIAEVMS
jgi:protein gp37